MIGTRVGNYQVVSELGQGGMGIVYLAQHSMLGRPAAVKVLRTELSSNREVVNRFFNEARAATAIRHPGIVEIYDFGYLPDGSAYIIMELLEGETLSSRIMRLGRLPAGAVLTMARQIASALQAAHARQIVHRDLKPENIFLVPDPDLESGERLKLLDFGIAKLSAAAGERSQTRTGEVIGTPTFMSPEQCRGTGKVDFRSDLYSLGCLLYVLLCGRPPFIAEGDGDLIAHHLYFPPEPPSNHEPSIPHEVERLILALLAKSPEERPATTAAVIEELDRLIGGRPRRPASQIAPLFPSQVAASSRPGEQSRKSQTTLSGSISASKIRAAAEPTMMVARWKKRSTRAVVASVGSLALIALAAWLLRTSPTGIAAQEPAPASPPQRPGEQRRLRSIQETAPAPSTPTPISESTVAVDAGMKEDAPRVRIRIDSAPSNAEVLREGREVGRTPFSEELPRANEPRTYTLRKRGYGPMQVVFNGTLDEQKRIELPKLRAVAPAPGKTPVIEPVRDKNDGINPFAK